MKNRIKYFLQPFLLLLVPISELFRNNVGEIYFFDVFFLSTLLGLGLILLYLILLKIWRDEAKVSISLSLACSALLISAQIPSWTVWIWVICALASIISLFISISEKIRNAGSFALILPLTAVLAYNIVVISTTQLRIENEIANRDDSLPNKKIAKAFDGNIYLIILDEFVSEKSFNTYYHYDNTRFFEFLRSKNFILIPDSTSNYPWTIPSVSSILNFDYHQTGLEKNAFAGVAQDKIRNANLFKILRNEGYEINHIPSIYWLGNPKTNIFNDSISRTKSYGLIESLSKLTPWSGHHRHYQKTSHYHHALFQLEDLEHVSQIPGKQFAFAHIMCPHRPIVFEKDGTFISDKYALESEKDKEHRFYLNQAYFISTKISETIDAILKNSKISPIIILLSDHGKFPIGSIAKGKEQLPVNEIAWRFSNLHALFLPNSSLTFSSQCTPVNSIRATLSHYFGYDLIPLEDRCHYHFSDLTKSIPNTEVIENMTPSKKI